MPNIDRRAILAGITTAVAVSGAAAPTEVPDMPAPILSAKARATIAEFREAVAREYKAINHEMSIEARKGETGYRRYRQAVKRSEFLSAERSRLGERIVRAPVRNLEDAALLAVVCYFFDEQVPYGECIGDELPSAAVCNLIDAVLKLGGVDMGKPSDGLSIAA